MKAISILSFLLYCPMLFGQTNPFLNASDKASDYDGDYISDFTGSNSGGSGFSSDWSETITAGSSISTSSSIYNWGQMSSKAFTLSAGNGIGGTGTINLVRTFGSSFIVPMM